MMIFKKFKKKTPRKISDILKTKDFTEKFINDFYLY